MIASYVLSMPLFPDLMSLLSSRMTLETAVALAAYNFFMGAIVGFIYLCIGPKIFPWNCQWVTGRPIVSPPFNGRPIVPRITVTQGLTDIEKQEEQGYIPPRSMRAATAEPEMLRPGAARHSRRN